MKANKYGDFEVEEGEEPDFAKAFTYTVEDKDGTGHKHIPVGECRPQKGGTHAFHGLGMYPCSASGRAFPDGIQPLGGGPYLGGPDKNVRKIYDHEIEDADAYIEEFTPSELYAYSRGGAVAQASNAKNMGNVKYLAPAWGRGFGVNPGDVSGGGIVYASGGDKSVPTKNLIQGAKSGGMKLYIHPVPNHADAVNVAMGRGSHKGGDIKLDDYLEFDLNSMTDDVINELPGGIGTAKMSNDEIKQQQSWIIKYAPSVFPFNPGMKLTQEEYDEVVASRQDTQTESMIRQLVNNILSEKKKVKCPLKNGKRDYKCEYRKYGGASKKGKKDRAARNQARKVAEREGRVKKGDGKEIDHKKPLSKGGSNAKSNQRVVSRSTNRKKGNK